MKTTVVRERFLSTLQNAGFFTSSKINELSSLRGALIIAEKKGIVVKTTNINDYYVGECGGKVEEEGSVLVDFKTFFETTRSFSDAKITIETAGKSLLIKGGPGEARLPLMDSEGFPKRAVFTNRKEVEKGFFSHPVLDPVLFSAATEETRPILTGICIQTKKDGTTLVGTDGFRMSRVLRETPGSETTEGRYIISSRSLTSALKVFEGGESPGIFFSTEGNVIEFIGPDQQLQTRLLDGEFPPFEKVMPGAHETQLVFKKEDLIGALRTVGLFARDGSRMVVFKISKTSLTLSSVAANSGEGHSEIPLSSFEGKENKITFNYKYLIDVLAHLTSSEVVFEMSNPHAPGVFKNSAEDGFAHIIMPIRTQE